MTLLPNITVGVKRSIPDLFEKSALVGGLQHNPQGFTKHLDVTVLSVLLQDPHNGHLLLIVVTQDDVHLRM